MLPRELIIRNDQIARCAASDDERRPICPNAPARTGFVTPIDPKLSHRRA